jgi:hypothetical protein
MQLPSVLREALEQEMVQTGPTLREAAFKVCADIMEAVEHFDEHVAKEEQAEGACCLAARLLLAGQPFSSPFARLDAIVTILAATEGDEEAGT